MTWISPNNVNLAIITGSQLGLGFNPITTFDWNVANSYNTLTTPFFSTAHLYVGQLISAFALLIVYYKNVSWSGYLPINSSGTFTNTGESYNVSQVTLNNQLDETKYQQYSPPFYSAGNLVVTGIQFILYPLWFLYIFGNQWRTIRGAFIDFYKGLRYGKGNYEDATDVYSRNMSRFKEVPDWWFLIILSGTLTLAFVFCKIYPIGVPEWLVLLPFAVNLCFMIPLAVLTA